MLTSWQSWQEWHKHGSYTSLPYMKRLELDWFDYGYVPAWTEVWQNASPYAFVLESGKVGRYTYLGLSPESVIYGTEEQAYRKDFDKDSEQAGAWQQLSGKPLDLVSAWMKPYISPRVAGAPKFNGGCVGFWGYDVVRTIERLPKLAKRDLSVPDYLFMRMNEVWVLDHEEQAVYCINHRAIDTSWNEQQLRACYERAVGHADSMV